jgi:phosphopantothenoylcysteine decarboxylase/phosphopantothenate--cysteine ligase
MLRSKKILLGVCGSIAAYKAAVLTRLLVKSGAEVQVIMTHSAHDFITPTTLATLSKNPALTDFHKDDSGTWNNHVALGLWADAFVIAPASANTLAKMAHGACDNVLLATYLSARCPVFFAPAMDLDMLEHRSTQENIQRLQSFGNHLIEPTHGELASGLVGKGRMAEPEEIIAFLEKHFADGPFKGKNVLITAGPTYEAIDPVRFIGNHASGKMGFALAERFANLGATVHLITGPTHLSTNHTNIQTEHVTSASEMYNAAASHFPTCDIAVMAAAVADYTPASVAPQKIKKTEGDLTITLTKTTDIAGTFGKQKRANQLLIGFALETEHEREHALKKLTSKNLDLIVLNSLNDSGAGFGHNTNKITIIDRNHEIQEFGLKDKKEVADDITHAILKKFYAL